MIIDHSNAPCGPGSIPGLRLSEGRFPINRAAPLRRGLPAVGASQAVRGLRPPKCRPEGSPSVASPTAGCLWTMSPSSRRRGVRGGLPSGEPRSPRGESHRPHPLALRPQIRRDDPLNLSILLSGGKETNQDSLSSGERRGKSPAPNPRPRWARELWRTGDGCRPGVGRGPESF